MLLRPQVRKTWLYIISWSLYDKSCCVFIVHVFARVPDLSFCVVQFSSIGNSVIVILLVGSAELALGALMCLLVVVQFIRELLQIYKATKRFRPNHYTILLVREGMIYFLAYVHVSSFLPYPLSSDQTKGELL